MKNAAWLGEDHLGVRPVHRSPLLPREAAWYGGPSIGAGSAVAGVRDFALRRRKGAGVVVRLDLQGRCGECLLYSAIQGLDDGLVLVDLKGAIFHINRRAEAILGLSSSRAMGARLRSCLRQPSLLRFWSTAVRSKEPLTADFAMPGAVQLRATVSLCRSTAGDPIGRALLLRDVTREKRIQVELSASVARRLVEMAGPGEDTAGEGIPLTARERQILGLLAEGLGNAAIAARIRVSANTVASHLKHLYTKIGAHNRAQAVAYALSRGNRPSAR